MQYFFYYTAGSYTIYTFYSSSFFSRVRKVKDDVGEIPFSILFIVGTCYYIIIHVFVTTTVALELYCCYLMSQKVEIEG